jgi:imidazolonepropionase-like amidohydrolase
VRPPIALIAAALIGPLLTGSVAAQTIAITGGTVYPVSGPKIENGTVLIRDGRIEAVGAGIAVPPDATRVDAAGRWVTPGLIHLKTTLGIHLLDSGGQDETQEDVLEGQVKAAFNVVEGLNPASITIPVARMEGVTTAAAVPSEGLIPGQAALIDLDGERVDEMLVKAPVAMVADLSEDSKESGGGSRAGAVLRLRRVLRDAREYAERRDDFRQARIQPLAAPAEDLEALQPVLRGELPMFVIANRRSDIESVLRIARELKLRIAIYGGAEAWQVAPALAAAGVPVILEPLTDLPSFDAPGARLDNATLLRQAGVQVVAAQTDAAHFRDLRQAAGNQVRNGMSWDDALRTVTLAAAEVALVADRYGSLEAGKMANVVVWSGDPLELSSRVEHLYIRGRPVPLVSRQTQLLQRYRTLPPAY